MSLQKLNSCNCRLLAAISISLVIGLTSVVSAKQGAYDTAKTKTLNYTWLTMGEPSGKLAVAVKPSSERIIDFEFNDRGRGPKNKTIVKFGKNNIPVSVSVVGNNYTKGAINEFFSVSQDTAKWSSETQNGQATFSESKFYLAVNDTPEYRAILARALLSSPINSLELIPSGEAKIRKVQSLEFSNETQEIKSNLYEITGLGLTPTYIWLDENKELFGFDAGWFAVLRDGWIDSLENMQIAQSSALEEYSAEQFRRLGHPIENLMVIQGAHIFDVTEGNFSAASTVTIQGGRIVDIREGYIDAPEGALVKDGRGKYLMPSLWDMHGHMVRGRFLNYVSGGVLNVRDMANSPEYIEQVQEQIEAKHLAGPDIYPVGFIDKRGEFAAPTGRLASNLEEALVHVDEYAERGYSGIKLYSSVEPEWIIPIAEKAHALGMKVMGHIPSFMSAEEAIEAGYDEVTHINMLLLQLLGDKSVDTRSPLRFTVPGEKGGQIDLGSSETRQFIALMKDKKIAHDPTMATFMDIFRNRAGKIATISEIYADHLPPTLRRREIGAKSYNDGHEGEYIKTAEKSLQLLKLLHDNGITILPGTDYQLPGFSIVSELELYQEAGISNADILKIATIAPARYLGLDQELGSVESGKKAYLILLNENPLSNVSALRNIDLVIKGDVFFMPDEIFISQGIKPFH